MSFLKTFVGKIFAKPIKPTRTIPQPWTITNMSEQPLGHSSTFHDPKPQPFYTFENETWQKTINPQPTYPTLPTIKLVSWNIDFQASNPQARMTRALEYLHQLISALPTSTPSIILLQEMTSSDLTLIQHTDWIQQNFHITDPTAENWLSHYGTTALIDRRLHIASIFRVRYTSDMDRDALFVDIEDCAPTTLRFCNTHLESLVAQPPLRPAQVKLAARYLKDPAVDGGVMAGDFNAMQDFDRTLHSVNGLKDAYLESGGEEGSEEGWTWGMHSPNGKGGPFGCKRMDKILYCGRAKVENLEKIGAGVRADGPEGGQFATDHLGLMADVIVAEEPA